MKESPVNLSFLCDLFCSIIAGLGLAESSSVVLVASMLISPLMVSILYTYTVSRVTYTDEYGTCIWTSLGEFRYEQYESVYVTLLTLQVFYYPNITNLYYLPNIKYFRKAKTLLGHAIHNGMLSVRATVLVTLGLLGSGSNPVSRCDDHERDKSVWSCTS